MPGVSACSTACRPTRLSLCASGKRSSQPNLQVAESVLGHQGPGRRLPHRPPRQGGLTTRQLSRLP
jgi:hypothetical protein